MTAVPPTGSLISARLGQAMAEMRERVEAVSEEAVTGRHRDLTAHLGGRIGQAMLAQKALASLALERDQISLRESRLGLTQQGLAAIHDSADGLAVRLQDALGMGEDFALKGVARDARAALEQVFTVLNTRHGERYLFAGEATATRPMAGSVDDLLADIRQIAGTAGDAGAFETALDDYFNTPGGGWQAARYGGSATPPDGDAVTAADPAITQLISGLAVMALSSPDQAPALFDRAPDALEAAASRLSAGQTALMEVRAGQGLAQSTLASRREALDMEETVLTAALNELSARDQYEAATELRELERNLEAAYMVTARLANLSLTNFLR